jgi:hypothetical protein
MTEGLELCAYIIIRKRWNIHDIEEGCVRSAGKEELYADQNGLVKVCDNLKKKN